ncbi:citrate synthase [Actinomadura sp. J1-007]|nr:citrate synthase [Actinomadura sp. J1-007]
MAGRRAVREWDPTTGRKRLWHETVDHEGRVRQVRPEFNNGKKTHYMFDRNGRYTGKW